MSPTEPHRADRAADRAEQAALHARRVARRLTGSVVIVCAFVVLIPALVGFVVLDRSQQSSLKRAQRTDAWARYDNAIMACARGNLLRLAVNEQAQELKLIARALTGFLDTSVVLRRKSGRPELAKQAAMSRDEVSRIQHRIRSIPPVDCAVVITRPTVRRPQQP